MKVYAAYLFDWDGTLARTLEIWHKLLKTQYYKYNLTPTDKQISEGFGSWKTVLEFGLPPEKLDEFNTEVKAISHKLIPNAPLYDGAEAYITSLQQRGMKIALITSTVRKTIDVVLHHHNLAEKFDVIVTADDVTEHKPHPECIEFALKELNIIKQDAVMIGDSDKDLGAAQAAGVDSILFYPKSHELFYNKEFLLSFKPVKVISSWQELTHAKA